MRYISNQKIEETATALLENTDALQVPVPLERVALHLGLQLEKTALGEDVSGVLVVEGSRGMIGYNKADASVRQRFTIAHEIGHYALHQQHATVFIDKTYTAVYKRDGRSSQGEHTREIQANQFAAALLMPRKLLHAEIEEMDFDLGDERALDELADKFKVSRQAMTFRLSNLGVFAGAF
jgi:Zn-dependent peptidase ImmA (M78 family)